MDSFWPLVLVGAFIVAAVLFVLNKNKKPAPPKMREDYPHYVVVPCKGLPIGGRLLIEFDAIGPFPDDATVTPYFQREGDDWLARNGTEAYRWWASFATRKLTPGRYVFDIAFTDNWTGVLPGISAKTNPHAFREALAFAHKVGFTIGDVTGLGHGKNPKGAIENVIIAVG